ncbi:hypothetical protein L596_000653 [Steinernema carpocapsae]|uniref:Uncharacterized protein n=1 Tax=Steinernema carpocapsae TaxID=34508 RepID=A0A4U8UL45_STECR|nr:hypothetical protein L596_000653 [Steinernema carpocapsae]
MFCGSGLTKKKKKSSSRISPPAANLSIFNPKQNKQMRLLLKSVKTTLWSIERKKKLAHEDGEDPTPSEVQLHEGLLRISQAILKTGSCLSSLEPSGTLLIYVRISEFLLLFKCFIVSD